MNKEQDSYSLPEDKIKQGIDKEIQSYEAGDSDLQQYQKLNFKPYTIQEELGSGGFGKVYKALNEENQQYVALKFLKSKLQLEEEWQEVNGINYDNVEEEFVKEANNLQKCFHSNIVEFIDLKKTHNGWCIVMEYIDGKNLKDWLEKQDQPLTERNALNYIRQIGEALEKIHSLGIVHRDVAPKNIILKRNSSQVILIDMGISRHFSQDNSKTISKAYSKGFTPPEQEREYPAIKGSFNDVYALAATFYYLLTKDVPSHFSIREKKDTFIPKLSKNNSISKKTKEAIEKGMKLKWNERPKSIAEWLNLLPPIETNQIKDDSNNVSENLELLLGRASLMGSALWSIIFNFQKQSGFLLMLSIALLVIAQFNIKKPETLMFLIISSIIPSLFIYIVMKEEIYYKGLIFSTILSFGIMAFLQFIRE
ncbi:serine/threonine protein kinase [Nostoc spongiaeforme FACHB-130]|uniref:Serine/threonine protein kinase n=1 Tax=Nostoc spongiaeforme FACHB-130 TaxID=1357510 RepID=A0ABR8G4V2_9NOSO|nr:serine/threonine-protein kinase [Nostoc spongiaeforme]MBD2598309.1 serine/threonine protein kinase [Nostoc spongiaeforme FACHB-130]